MIDHITNLQRALAQEELDAMLIKNSGNLFYLTGFYGAEGAAVITRAETFFFTDSRYIEAARKTVRGMTIELIDAGTSEKDRISKALASCTAKSLGVEEESLSYAGYRRVQEDFGLPLVPSQRIVRNLRASKSRREVLAIRAAQEIAEDAFDYILGFIQPGMSERRIAAELIYQMLLLGAEGISFDPIVVTGEKSSMPHGVPGEKLVEKGDFITLDFGCVKHGYCSDMTRTVAVERVSEKMKRVYHTVLEAQLAGISAARAGVAGREIDAAARQVIEKAGYGGCFGHGFGHSLGIEVHERPNASPAEKELMPSGAVISAEPGIYLPGEFGVRIEDMLYLGEKGCENLTKAPKNLIIL